MRVQRGLDRAVLFESGAGAAAVGRSFVSAGGRGDAVGGEAVRAVSVVRLSGVSTGAGATGDAAEVAVEGLGDGTLVGASSGGASAGAPFTTGEVSPGVCGVATDGIESGVGSCSRIVTAIVATAITTAPRRSAGRLREAARAGVAAVVTIPTPVGKGSVTDPASAARSPRSLSSTLRLGESV